MKIWHRLLTLTLALLLAAPACALGETVVTSFYPIYLFTLNLTQGVEGLEVRSLTTPGAGCLHDYQLQTGDMKALNRADLFLINGAGMEGYLAGVFDAFPELKVVDASKGIELLASCVEHDHDHDHDHDHGHEHEMNPHIWLDAGNAILMVQNLADGLMEAFPQHAAAIAANREAYTARLAALDAELKQALSGLERRDVVTFHEAFPYFAHAYGLNVAAVLNQEPDDALSPRQLADLVRTVRQLGNPPLFVEPQFDDMAARIIAGETGAQIFTLDPVVTAPEEGAALTHYEDAMRQNLQTLQTALAN